MAHDLNNLLTLIGVAADAILSRTQQDPDTLRDARQVQLVVRRGSNLIKQLLLLGRPSSPNSSQTSVNNAVQELARLCDRLLGPQIQIEVHFDPTDRLVHIEPSQLEHILLNLVFNARDAMPNGGTLSFRISAKSGPGDDGILSDHSASERYVVIDVSDSGHGIAEHVLPHIFSPYFTTKSDVGGCGLGLAGVKEYINMIGGMISVATIAGQGTTVSLYLPWFGQIGRSAEPSGGVPDAPALETSYVLLVEDEMLLRQSTERGLRAIGWNVVSAASGEEALGHLAIATHLPAVIVTDANLSGMDGIGLIKAIREKAPYIPAIVVSGYPESTAKGQVAIRWVSFIAKPFDIAVLVYEIKKWCRYSQ